MNPLDQLLKDHVTPVLTEHGFAKAGKVYRREAGTGDLAFVVFRRWQTGVGEHAEFVVNVSVLPTTQWAWLVHDQPKTAGRKPQYGDGLWQGQVAAPAEFAAGEWDTERWRIADPSDVDRVGAGLAQVLTEQTVPMLTRMLDRKQFLTMIEDPAYKPGLGHGEVMLLVGEGPSPELEAALAWYDAKDPAEWPAAARLARWARAYAAGKA
ncbi:DUF4304 domain-containing protein [Kribbella endophytica]